MEGRFLLNVVVRKGSAVFKLLSSEDESLLIGGDSLLILDLCLDVIDGVRRLNIKSDGLAGKGLDEDLHATAESENEMESRFLLDIVIRKSSAVLKLLASEDKSLLIGRDSFLVLDLGLDVVNGVRRLNIEGDGLASQCLDEDLHATAESENEMESAFLLDIVVGKSSAVFKLLASEDESLLIGRDSLLILDLGLDIVDGVRRLNIKSDGLSSKGLNEDLHFVRVVNNLL